MRVLRVGVALAAASALALGLTACGGEETYASVADKVTGAKTIVVGTKWDQPGLGLKKGAEPEGFDVDVAKYIVKQLGGGEDVKIEWKESASSNREPFLANGTVDLIVASYSITDERKTKVTFGGPYIVAHQDTMVRADDADHHQGHRPGGQADLPGRRLQLLQADHRPAAGRQARPRRPARRRGQLLGVRRQAERQQPRRRHHRRPHPRRFRRPGSRVRWEVQGPRRPLHRREVRRRPEEGRHQDLRGRQRGDHQDVPGRHRQAAAGQVVRHDRGPHAAHRASHVRALRLVRSLT